MGANPSKDLYYAARAGNVLGMQAALDAGGDVNFRVSEKRNQTPLIAAAKHGRVPAVRWLLAHGALDYRTADGASAMHEAARFGHDRAVAVLLDRGSDHFGRSSAGLRAVEKAAEVGHAHVVRLIEARTCPFFASADVEIEGWFSKYFEPRWVAVHRARPHDNPGVDRQDVKLCVYLNTNTAAPELELVRPRLQPISVDGEDNVTFALIPRASCRGASRPRAAASR